MLRLTSDNEELLYIDPSVILAVEEDEVQSGCTIVYTATQPFYVKETAGEIMEMLNNWREHCL